VGEFVQHCSDEIVDFEKSVGRVSGSKSDKNLFSSVLVHAEETSVGGEELKGYRGWLGRAKGGREGEGREGGESVELDSSLLSFATLTSESKGSVQECFFMMGLT